MEGQWEAIYCYGDGAAVGATVADSSVSTVMSLKGDGKAVFIVQDVRMQLFSFQKLSFDAKSSFHASQWLVRAVARG